MRRRSTSLNAARATFGPHPDVLTYLGFANRKLGRFEAAETYYRAALAAAPEHRGATEYYGELMAERGDLEGAERDAGEARDELRFRLRRGRRAAAMDPGRAFARFLSALPLALLLARRRATPDAAAPRGATGWRPASVYPRPHPGAARMLRAARRSGRRAAGRDRPSRLPHAPAARRPGGPGRAELRELPPQRPRQSRLPLPRPVRRAGHGRRHRLADEQPSRRRPLQSEADPGPGRAARPP